MTLEDVLRAPLPGRVDDVVERLQAPDVVPTRDRQRHAEYRAIDPLLAETEARVRADAALGELDSVVTLDRLVGLASRGLLRRVV